jgi:hypothetical protein
MPIRTRLLRSLCPSVPEDSNRIVWFAKQSVVKRIGLRGLAARHRPLRSLKFDQGRITVLGTLASFRLRRLLNPHNRHAFIDLGSISVTDGSFDPNRHSIQPDIPLKSFPVGLHELLRNPLRCCLFLDLQIPLPAFCKQSPST